MSLEAENILVDLEFYIKELREAKTTEEENEIMIKIKEAEEIFKSLN